MRIRRTYFRHQTLEETCKSLILDHTANDPESALWVLKVSVLDSSLDNIERS